MIVKLEKFLKLIEDPKWRKLLIFKDDGTTWIDLQTYSDGRVYHPIGGSYVEGFFFTEELYSDKYRTKDNLLELEIEEDLRLKGQKIRIVPEYEFIPTVQPISLDETDPSLPPDTPVKRIRR